ncbi:MAG: arsenical pump-driving ATPase [Thermoleophilia bacterium]|jgi:arsenite-transporting ATPase|nr:arsenical pump-driving ATPase [Thermoleophilia bacterium]
MLLAGDLAPVMLFTGKGGQGKTTLACATALALADRGRRVLLVSTDPASNLSQVLGTEVGPEPAPVPGAPGLQACDIDPDLAARAYRERVVGPYRGVLPEPAVRSIEEQLSGACTLEVAAFDEFARLLGDPGATAGLDHIIFDTAPTGHTLRLLALPAAWSGYLETSPGGASCLGPLAGLERQQATYRAALDALRDPARTLLVLVTRPDPAGVTEAERARAELAAAGLGNQRLMVNGVFVPEDPDDPLARAMAARGAEALRGMPAGLAALPVAPVPLVAEAPVGLAGLRALSGGAVADTAPAAVRAPDLPGLADLVDRLEPAGRGVIMTMGKGGVGKTTLAAAIALELARRGHPVTLSTTDPAAHLALALGGEVPEGLTLGRIDPAAETAAYTAEVLAEAGAGLDPAGRALLEEDLRSPCTEEVAVFRAFARTVAGGAEGFVVLDTAPTGHTLLLLDATQAYHRDVERTTRELPEPVRMLLPRLRDPAFTRVLIVTLPEPTPIQEATQLAGDLERAGIAPAAWVVNQALCASGPTDPVLAARAGAEVPRIAGLAAREPEVVVVPWAPAPPVGADGLAALVHQAASMS